MAQTRTLSDFQACWECLLFTLLVWYPLVETKTGNAQQIIEAVKQAGFNAEEIKQ